MFELLNMKKERHMFKTNQMTGIKRIASAKCIDLNKVKIMSK